MDFIVGGYYLVRGAERAEYMDASVIPATFWSISTCICDVPPFFRGNFVWPQDIWHGEPRPDEEPRDLLALLQVSEEAFTAMQTRFVELRDSGECGWPNVFSSAELAREFYATYFWHVPDVKLLSIALEATLLAQFEDEDRYTSFRDGASTPHVDGTRVVEVPPGLKFYRIMHPIPEYPEHYGVMTKLQARERLAPGAVCRGFELLGQDYWDFHSFACHNIGTEFQRDLGIEFNANGLVGSYEEAVRAWEWLNEPAQVDRVEDADWFPWLVSEYPLGP